MASKKVSLVGSTAHVYDTQDNLLSTTKITAFNPAWSEIEIEECPDLKRGDTCRLLILSFPSPCEYMGTVRRQMELAAVIALYRKKEKENRKNTRYKVNIPLAVEKIVCADAARESGAPLTVRLLNLSKGGVRVGADTGTFWVGDRFEMTLNTGEQAQRLFAEVVNTSPAEGEAAEYGCRFIAALQ